MPPKISVITVSLNIKTTIERTIISIIKQDFKSYEWIVVDGGSTDGTVDIYNKYRNYINVFFCEKDKGIYDAMNKGIKAATGEYVIFLNGGDSFFNISVLSDVFNQNNYNSHVIYGNTNNIVDGQEEIYLTPDIIDTKTLFKRTIPHQAAFIKRELFKKRLYSLKYKISADYDFFIWAYLNKKAKYKKINITISNFYFDGISTTNKALSLIENDKIRQRRFSFLQHLRYNPYYIEKNQHLKMAVTHPRYIAGWIKQKIIQLWRTVLK